MIHIPFIEYIPNSAATNRLLAYLKVFSEEGIKARVYFFLRENGANRVKEQLPGIEFIYMWDRWYINLPRINKMISLRLYIHHFIKELSPGDKVFVYGFPDMLVSLSRRNDLRVFHETTEHPCASFCAYLHGTTLNRYLDVCSNISGLIVISEALKDYFIKKGCPPNRVHVVNMIVDSTRFIGLQKQSSDKFIAYCGTASNSKDGVDQLIKSFALVREYHPQYKLLIIGNTPSSKQRFDNYELVKQLGIEHNVVFTGAISSADIPQMLKDAEALVLDRPDNLQAKYGFPTKLGEYLLSGNPVVVTRVGDIPLFLKDGDSALLAEPDSPECFAEKICWVIEHPKEAIAIGARGRLVADTFFNYRKETNKLISIMNINPDSSLASTSARQ